MAWVWGAVAVMWFWGFSFRWGLSPASACQHTGSSEQLWPTGGERLGGGAASSGCPEHTRLAEQSGGRKAPLVVSGHSAAEERG